MSEFAIIRQGHYKLLVVPCLDSIHFHWLSSDSYGPKPAYPLQVFYLSLAQESIHIKLGIHEVPLCLHMENLVASWASNAGN